MTNQISVVLPAYMEADNLVNILPRIHQALYGVTHEILVVDTMTPLDHTADVCKANDAKYCPRTGGNNYGDAIRTGVHETTGKYLVIMDADGSHDPKEIVHFYEEMEKEECNLVIGSRYCDGGYTDNPAILKLMSWMLNVTYRVCFGLKVKDVSNSFRMYRADEVRALELKCNNFDIVEEMLIGLCYSIDGFKIKELPISFNRRDKGESKRNLVKFIFSYIETMWRLMKIKNKYEHKS